MTLSSTATRIRVSGNGSTKTFSFNFRVDSQANARLTYTDTTGANTVLSSGLWSITGTGLDAGGTFTYPTSGSAIASGTYLTLERVTPVVQGLQLPAQGTVSPPTVEASLDTLTEIAQETADKLSRAITIPATDPSSITLTLPAASARANQGLLFDVNGNPVAGAVAGAPVSSAMQPVVAAATLAAAQAAMGLATPAIITSINGGPIGGFRNRVRNGDMRVFQRGGTLTLAGAAAYLIDGWHGYGGGGTMSRIAGPTNFPNALQVAGAFGGPAVNWGHRFESIDVQDMAGKPATFSFQANAGGGFLAGQTVNWTMLVPNATDNWSGSTSIASGTVTFPLGWSTVTITSAGLAATVTRGLAIEFSFASLASGNNLQMTAAQLELGSVATSFERRPIGLDEIWCRRFLNVTQSAFYISGYAAAGAQAFYGNLAFPVQMRATPSATNNWTGAVNATGAAVGATATGALLSFNSSAAGVATDLYASGNVFSAEL